MIVDAHWHISAHFRFSFSGTLKCKMCLWYLMSVHVLSFHTHTYTLNTAFKQAKVRLYKIKSKWCNQELHTHHVLFHHSQKDTKVNFPRDWKHFLDFVFLCWKSKDSQANLRYTHNPPCCATELLYSELTICADWEKLFKKKKNEQTNIPVMSMVPVPWGSKRSKAVFMSLICISVSWTWILSRPSFSIGPPEAAALRELEAWKIKCQFTISHFQTSL